MLFKLLKLAGLDVRAEIAAVRGQIEQRVDEVAGRAKHAAATGAVIAALAILAGLFSIMAICVGLIALYRAAEAAYGANVALGIVAAVLIAATLILLVVAAILAKSLSGAAASKALAQPAAAAPAPQVAPPEALVSPPAGSAGDLAGPLTFLLALFAKDPKLGHPVLDEFVTNLQTPAGGSADEAVEQALNLVRKGDRTQLAIILGAAALAGWLLARSRPEAAPRFDPTQK
jgi:hypothetical protein